VRRARSDSSNVENRIKNSSCRRSSGLGPRRHGSCRDEMPLVVLGAVEVTTNSNWPGVVALTCTVTGEVAGDVLTEHAPSGGAPEHASATAPENPADDWTSRLNVCVWPAGSGSLMPWPGAVLGQKSIAVPASAMLCGLPGALSVSESVALRAPPLAPQGDACCGLNCTEIVQEFPGEVEAAAQASDEIKKSAAFVPEVWTERMVSGPA